MFEIVPECTTPLNVRERVLNRGPAPKDKLQMRYVWSPGVVQHQLPRHPGNQQPWRRPGVYASNVLMSASLSPNHCKRMGLQTKCNIVRKLSRHRCTAHAGARTGPRIASCHSVLHAATVFCGLLDFSPMANSQTNFRTNRLTTVEHLTSQYLRGITHTKYRRAVPREAVALLMFRMHAWIHL